MFTLIALIVNLAVASANSVCRLTTNTSDVTIESFVTSKVGPKQIAIGQQAFDQVVFESDGFKYHPILDKVNAGYTAKSYGFSSSVNVQVVVGLKPVACFNLGKACTLTANIGMANIIGSVVFLSHGGSLTDVAGTKIQISDDRGNPISVENGLVQMTMTRSSAWEKQDTTIAVEIKDVVRIEMNGFIDIMSKKMVNSVSITTPTDLSSTSKGVCFS